MLPAPAAQYPAERPTAESGGRSRGVRCTCTRTCNRIHTGIDTCTRRDILTSLGLADNQRFATRLSRAQDARKGLTRSFSTQPNSFKTRTHNLKSKFKSSARSGLNHHDTRIS